MNDQRSAIRDPRAAAGRAGRAAVVVVNWHGREATGRCLDALARLTYPHWFPVLVDNGCREFSAEELAARFPNGRYVYSEVNRGFAGGANLGLREAARLEADWVWFLNNDARPEPEALTELVAAAERDPQPTLVGAKILRGDAPERIDSVGLQVDLDSGRVRLIGHGEVDRGQYDLLAYPVAVTACAMLVNRVACEWLGGFSEAFFSYMEDADFCLRARATGWRTAFAPRARVLHDRRPAHRGRQSAASLYYSTRNHLLLLQLHSPVPPWRRKLQELRIQALSAAFALRTFGSLRAVRDGVRDYRAAVYGPGSYGGAPPA